MKINNIKDILILKDCKTCTHVYRDNRNELCGNIERIRKKGMPNYTSEYNNFICRDYESISWYEIITNWGKRLN